MANACSGCKYNKVCSGCNEIDGFEYCPHAADTVVQFIDWRMRDSKNKETECDFVKRCGRF